MLSLFVSFYLFTYNFKCTEINPLINSALLEELKYDGEGIPDLVYCKVKRDKL